MLNSLLVKSIIKKDIESGEITVDTSKKMDKENPSGTGSFSMNRKADTEVGANSTTEGTENVASGENSHAEGKMNTSSGNSSHAEGWNSKANGAQAHAEGSSTASGKNSHSEGTATKATSEASHAEGYYTIAGGGSAHAEGNNSSASGNSSHAEGYYAHADGASSHSEGQYTYAEGTASHSEGEYSQAQGIDSHAEGNRTTALGKTSHSEGSSTNNAKSGIKQDTSNDDVITYWESSKFSLAKGMASHVEGKDCLALGDYSHSGGLATRAGYQSQIAIGEYNENKEEDIFEVGNGNSNARSNALELTKTGDLKIGGSYIDGSGNVLSMDSANEYTDQKIADLINGAPTTLDTLKEIADAMNENQDVVKTLDESIGSKANASDLTGHTGNTNNPHNVTKEQLGLEDAVESEVAIDFSEAETPQFQQTIDDVLDGVNELKGDLAYLKDCVFDEIEHGILENRYVKTDCSVIGYDGWDITRIVCNEQDEILIYCEHETKFNSFYSNDFSIYENFTLLKGLNKVIVPSGCTRIYCSDESELANKIRFYYANRIPSEIKQIKSDFANAINNNLPMLNGWESDRESVIDSAYSNLLNYFKSNPSIIPIFVCTDGHRWSPQHPQRYVNNIDKDGMEIDNINLGDCVVGSWADGKFDTIYNSIKNIKNYIGVVGNHDKWAGTDTTEYYLNRLFNSNTYPAKRIKNSGRCCYSVKVDKHAIKYIVLDQFYVPSDNTCRVSIPTDIAKWLFDELSENDGYDIIMLCHQPMTDRNIHRDGTVQTWTSDTNDIASLEKLFTVMKDRKNKRSGTYIDDNGVSHSYDFTNCKNELLCMLHGHTHEELYLVEDGLLSYSCDWDGAESTGYKSTFIAIDRKNNKFISWIANNNVSVTEQFVVNDVIN